MNNFKKAAFVGFSVVAMMCIDFNLQSPNVIGFVSTADAIIGRPATPGSVAGVARRSTYRAVDATAVAATATVVAVDTSASANAQANASAQAQAAPAGVLEVGTIVSALPTGCNTTKVVNNSSYYDCGGVYYKAGYQSGNLVYVVSAPQ